MRILARAALAVTAAAALTLSGCSSSEEPAAADPLSGELTVFAAASLQDAFDDIGEAFTKAHPNLRVSARYDGSPTLVTQLQEGADADVLATADERTMATAVEAGVVQDPKLFASNTLVVAVPAGNPGNVDSLDDLAHVTTVVCAPEVPCGAAARQLLSDAGVQVTPASQEQNVSAVLTKVAAGEADAGLVYATDVAGDSKVESFVPDGAADVVNHYPIALADPLSEAASAFMGFVLGDDGQKILAEHGFGAP
ncbi:molybdate ABC transporter substrate-binding protein [Mycolicibacterium brumae]|uniref:Molybdate ABC transporter substrate-binding protein n=1 Tax=Mycolicibacterium brumae TaxID=85968 RepID=A0A2G5PCL0_9MYCO|nr:molybdate ABC transporter substrate-binding protein [Mycolicibacterium brumae]MCV7193483.1 molybdate ABC transporter substrate-binding protein [Mycolicibacterium brumae]PIB76069.1 molybdate ABC transporter substrate-binding protein [Mycolicibacterium brumae]RWA17182.1 hypothetical protein MBRU_06040 [Mycolicibacterium brumae DSM 44177]UWW09244.1 molybdate ABC transporter substrate-binding protein [Mycolicibacterium brumae]